MRRCHHAVGHTVAVPVIFAAAAPPVVVRVVSSGPSWLTLLGTFIVGTATALVIQLYVVPRVETRKRREDRWERDVRELSEVLTTSLTRLASEAHAAQMVFRTVHAELGDEYDPPQVARSARSAREATWAYGGLITARVELLVRRVASPSPKAQEIERLQDLARAFQIRAIVVRQPPDPDEDDKRTDAEFEEEWDKERAARQALIKQVAMLEDLRRPPR